MAKKYLNEWKRALEFLQAANNNLKLGDLKTAANRAYFSLERAIVCCLLIEFGKYPKNHKRIWELSKNLDLEAFELLRELYDLRLQADYGKSSEVAELNEVTVNDYLKKTEKAINLIKEKHKL